jgi:hypothetical protein
MGCITKTITMPDYLDRYVKDTNLNLSRFVQAKLKELIQIQDKAEQYLPKSE